MAKSKQEQIDDLKNLCENLYAHTFLDELIEDAKKESDSDENLAHMIFLREDYNEAMGIE